MSFGPAGFEDGWSEDEFDFGEHDPEYSAKKYVKMPAQNNVDTHVKDKHSPFPSKANINDNFGLQTNQNQNATSNTSLGRGRGKGGFSTPTLANRTNTARKNTNSKQNKGRGKFLFTRTGDKTNGKHHDLEEKKDHNQISEDLRVAILKGDVAVVVNILNQGISPDFILKFGWTGLMHAANYGRLATVAALTERGANVNFHKDMFSVLMAACSSDCDAEDDLVQCINHLIEKGAKINCHDRYHMTPLMYAGRNGRAQIIEILLSHNPDVNKQDQRGWTALGWTASRGHGRVVRMLLDANANPKLYTNDGQSAEDLAYDGGFTIIADVLNAAANPSRYIQQNPQNMSSSELVNEQGECHRYGDLELFLFGLELGHLVPLFQNQQVSFDGFLKLTDTDLQQIGVSQIGIRKKILNATHDVHTKPWDLSSLPSQGSSNQFTNEEMNLVLTNVGNHLLHIQCSVGYARKSLNDMQDPTVVIQDEQQAQQMLDKTKSVLRESSEITAQVMALECLVKKISGTVPSTPADLIDNMPARQEGKQKHTYLPVLLLGGCLALGLTALWMSRGTDV